MVGEVKAKMHLMI